MSRLNEMLKELCPDGVEYKKLGEIATNVFRGAGIKRDELTAMGIPCARYGEIYTTYGIWFDSCVSHTDETFLTNPKYFGHGDILFAITGESVEEIAKSTAYIGHDKCVAGGDIVVLQHEQDPKYLSYVLSTDMAQRQKSKGRVKSKVVHSNVPAIKEIVIPVPPLPIQNEIVKLLDNFTELTAELTAELLLRKKQYNFYRDSLLSFIGADDHTIQIERQENLSICEIGSFSNALEVKYVRLGEIGHFYGGLNGKSKADFQGGNEPFITYMEVYSNLALKEPPENLVRIGVGECQNTVDYGDIMFTGSSETREECGISCVMTEPLKQKVYLNSFCFGYRFDQSDMLLPAFSKYLFRSKNIRAQIIKTASGVTRFNVSKKKMENVTIPIPPLEVQKKIVSILDRFDALCNDLTQGLPAEIAARKKQYEYYRDKLLTFPRKAV